MFVRLSPTVHREEHAKMLPMGRSMIAGQDSVPVKVSPDLTSIFFSIYLGKFQSRHRLLW